MTGSQKTKKKPKMAAATAVKVEESDSALNLFELMAELPELEIPDRKKDLARIRRSIEE